MKNYSKKHDLFSASDRISDLSKKIELINEEIDRRRNTCSKMLMIMKTTYDWQLTTDLKDGSFSSFDFIRIIDRDDFVVCVVEKSTGNEIIKVLDSLTLRYFDGRVIM